MEQYTAIDRKLTGHFMVVDYFRSLSQLLVRRSVKKGRKYVNENLDLTFYSCAYFELPVTLTNIHVTNGSDDDWTRVLGRAGLQEYDRSRNFYQLFKIAAGGNEYFVLASILRIAKNNLPEDETSIPSQGKYPWFPPELTKEEIEEKILAIQERMDNRADLKKRLSNEPEIFSEEFRKVNQLEIDAIIADEVALLMLKTKLSAQSYR